MNKRSLKKLWLLGLIVPILFLAACDNGGNEEDPADSDATAAPITATDNGENEDDPVDSDATAINPITAAEIEAFQLAWGEGLVRISTAFNNDEDYVDVAVAVLEDLYGYDYGAVLFKPTIASDEPFRLDWDGAASYFIGTSAPQTIDEDGTGFATNVWTNVEFQDDWTYVFNGETAIGMGTVVITDGDGGETTVHKSMAWFRGTDGNIRLQLHHSSVPFE
ncbi:MAG: hypothetical protein FWG67_09210 [Defluviitaleaceae bacterium]|nr:hypothetical protein [Defluviitaleaceae bacterium]